MGAAVTFYDIWIQQGVSFTCPCGREAVKVLYMSTGKTISGVVQEGPHGYRHGKLQNIIPGAQ